MTDMENIYQSGNIAISRDIIQKIKNLPYVFVPHYNNNEFQEQGYPIHLIQQQRIYGDREQENNSDFDFSWAEIFKTLDLHNVSLMFMEAKPGYCVPPHRDHFNNYSRYHGVTKQDVCRRLVFVEDWQSGHYFQVGDHVCVKWKSGDWIEWGHDDLHLGGNIGPVTRYTLQITGIRK